MHVDYELKAKIPEGSDFLVQKFWIGFLLILGACFTFVSIFLMLPFLMGISAFYGYIIFRRSNGSEVIRIDEKSIKAYRNNKIILSLDIDQIVDIDVDSFSTNNVMRGQSMIVFHLLTGDSRSINYVNYEYDDLKALKNRILN